MSERTVLYWTWCDPLSCWMAAGSEAFYTVQEIGHNRWRTREYLLPHLFIEKYPDRGGGRFMTATQQGVFDWVQRCDDFWVERRQA